MAEETWHAARLIPTSGINGAEEQERRATSALLAVMGAVREFGRAVTTRLGAPAGQIETFIEVPFYLGDKRLYPDGLIRVSRGQRTCSFGRGEDRHQRPGSKPVGQLPGHRPGTGVRRCTHNLKRDSGRSRSASDPGGQAQIEKGCDPSPLLDTGTNGSRSPESSSRRGRSGPSLDPGRVDQVLGASPFWGAGVRRHESVLGVRTDRCHRRYPSGQRQGSVRSGRPLGLPDPLPVAAAGTTTGD